MNYVRCSFVINSVYLRSGETSEDISKIFEQEEAEDGGSCEHFEDWDPEEYHVEIDDVRNDDKSETDDTDEELTSVHLQDSLPGIQASEEVLYQQAATP